MWDGETGKRVLTRCTETQTQTRRRPTFATVGAPPSAASSGTGPLTSTKTSGSPQTRLKGHGFLREGGPDYGPSRPAETHPTPVTPSLCFIGGTDGYHVTPSPCPETNWYLSLSLLRLVPKEVNVWTKLG